MTNRLVHFLQWRIPNLLTSALRRLPMDNYLRKHLSSLPRHPGTGSASAKANSVTGIQGSRYGPPGKRDVRQVDRRSRVQENRDRRELKRRRLDRDEPRPDPGDDVPFTAAEIAAEPRRPKHKVAVMIGYSGTGYRGMQINPGERTIEGDLFAAFVAAGAISRANADDHRKSSLVRCARTDKGVHAAGNVISLKLIVEAPDVVQRINDALPPQIRIWGIQRTNGAFNCYRACDSRWYEYLMPSYSLLPPHPDSYLWGRVVEAAGETGTIGELDALAEDVRGFWEEVDEREIKPLLAGLDADVRAEVLALMHASEDSFGGDFGGGAGSGATARSQQEPPRPAVPRQGSGPTTSEDPTSGPQTEAPGEDRSEEPAERRPESAPSTNSSVLPPVAPTESGAAETSEAQPPPPSAKPSAPVLLALRSVKAAYVAAKRRWRIGPGRLQRLQTVLDQYRGTNNFHNYTVQKSFRDPSARRHIKSFVANPRPVVIGNTEWLSLKVHGQSFMMHQIRKMVGLACLMVRCGTPVERVRQTFGERRIAIPKAPGLGLLLERPVFDDFNRKARESFQRETIDFDKYADVAAFKEREIYRRIFEVEEEENTFHSFYVGIDGFRSDYFLWLTAKGITDRVLRPAKAFEPKGFEEDEDPEDGEG